MATEVVPVILCGGAGARLWPLSTPEKPKPFHYLVGDGSLFQQALGRAAQRPFTKPPIVVAQARNAALVNEQAAALGIAIDLVLERQGRDTCVAALLGALQAERRHGLCLLGLLASDQYIPDRTAFAATLTQALAATEDGALVVFGVAPQSPSSAFGYIVPGEGKGAAVPVRRFVEKPDGETAATLIAAGARWNSGNFLVRSDVLQAAARLHCPSLQEAVTRAITLRASAESDLHVDVMEVRGRPLSLDRAIVERFANVRMVPADFAWSDVGTWDEVRALSGLHGPFTMSADRPVRVVGLEDVIVVATADGILVTRAGQSGLLKYVLENEITKGG